MKDDDEKIKDHVKEHYTKLVQARETSCCAPTTSCCSPSSLDIDLASKKEWAQTIGYTKDDLDNLPETVTDISFGCGNPTAIAELKPGEIVLDLGSGGGIDVFLSAKKVGESGKAIGLDMTNEMLERARKNAHQMGLKNVKFVKGEMENMPIEDNSIDVVISNCVINLSPNKDKVFQEIYRVLKPGGRMCVSDIVLTDELPNEIKEDLNAWAGCVAGALLEEEYIEKIKKAGLKNVKIQSKRTAVELASVAPENLKQHAKNIVSIKIKAFK
ncbi:MAG: methyltransferase domain-containing protein [Candidatus Lokiarchaeota archaeon]|nr:methyltransferase domain-containing protein [Candidatus Lokiarchaeota archaeon]